MGRSLMLLDVRYLLAVASILSIAALVLNLVNVKKATLPPSTKYGLVFDAGSTHTSLYIYQWPADKENTTGVVNQVSACRAQGQGISSYADNPAKAGESLKTCLDEAMTIIPAEQQKETPTLFGATAGMRLLRMKNSTKANQVLEEVFKTIKQYPLDFQMARILTGNEEGSLGWITSNYLLEKFIKYSFAGKWIHPWPVEVVGALDLGGASVEITFGPSGPIKNKDTEMFFRLYGYNYTIYTHSYLCYGVFQAMDMLLANITKGQDPSKVINHSCYPKGYQKITSLASIYNSSCVSAPAKYNPNQNITLNGTGNPAECKNAIRQLFNFSACGSNKTCSFNGVYQPPVHGQFYAFSAFHNVFHFLNLTSGQSLNATTDTIQQFCTMDWNKLKANFPKMPEKILRDFCAASIYILTLLVEGYKFDNETWGNIHFTDKVGNQDIGWSLGYMLNLTNMIPSEMPATVKGYESSTWAITIAMLFLTIVLTLLTILILFFQRRGSAYETML
ncbi:ectonucleoside triphosphate diphosphohydrolase 8-like isoform X2 [Rhinatrema bivittatum]|nr:ectonucleoside triphosphate diphosphohydrolase 8-like isoform X2 [Rhinatrema bivittatum]XP_029467433.1 ectonucleoside triphosphate diphosphohydrolase 8-like isoform X2 [Rhinatrema bivittatum]